MNEHEDFNPQQLELATSRSLPADTPLDGETAALRDGWLALGRSVESGSAGFREDALLERLAAGRPAKFPAPTVAVAAKPTTLPLWPMLLGIALALAMMVAVVRTLRVGLNGEAVVKAPDRATNPPEVVAPEIAALPPTIAAWTDPLDDEIDQALTQLRTASSRSGGVDDSLTALQTQLEQLSADLADGSL